jgi:hypothetical protein
VQAVVDAAGKGGVAVMGGASLDGDGVHVVRELLCDSFIWFEGALEGKVAGVEGAHRDFGDFVVVVANRQAKQVSPPVYW